MVRRRRRNSHLHRGGRIIMSAINHGMEVPTNSTREVLMGYQYALHQHKKKLREEKDEFRRSQENNSVSSGGYWDEYSDASESSGERHRDPKHSRRNETLCSYIQRWSIIKNSTEDVSDERAVDAFSVSLRRSDLMEDLGRNKS
jgi:hypothetical protein